jgi:hypothetical protein
MLVPVPVEELAMLSVVVSSISAAWRPRLSVATRFGCCCAGAVEDEDEDAGAAAAAVFVRVVRCLLVDCCFLDLALAVGAVRGEGGSEPIVAAVEIAMLVDTVDSMEVMVDVLRSEESLGAFLIVDSMSAMA